MIQTGMKSLAIAFAVGMMFSLAGCAKKAAKATPPTTTPPPPTPTATLAASPDVIQQGQSTTLSWQTTNATSATIAGLGTVPASGTQAITPNSSTTYTLEAKGPGGTQDASTRVTVSTRTATTTSSLSDEDLFAQNVKDVFFDYDKSSIRSNETSIAQHDASFLQQHPQMAVLVEGHCDDRGSEEYNLALGTSRAESMKQSLQQQGISADRIKTISYGKEKPFCSQEDEQCWQQNRVDHLALQR